MASSSLHVVYAGILFVTTAAAATSFPFDCSADYTDCWDCLRHHWSRAKLSYCCQHEKIGCPPVETTAVPKHFPHGSAIQIAATTTRMTTTRSTLVPMINVQIPTNMPPHGLDGVLVDTNCHGQDLAEVVIEGASDAARAGRGNLVVGACRLACLDTPGCIAWTLNYGSAGMQGRGHCWLKTSCTGQVKDTRAISGTTTDDTSSRNAQVIDGGETIKRMEEKSLQTKKIVGGVVGAGMGALAVGLVGGILGKRATDAKKQEQVGGVGGTRGMGGFTDRNNRDNFAGTVSDSSEDSASFAHAASMSSAVNGIGASASGLHGIANGSAASTAAMHNNSRDASLVVPETALRQTDVDSKEHTLTWWWIPLLLLFACLLCLASGGYARKLLQTNPPAR